MAVNNLKAVITFNLFPGVEIHGVGVLG